MAVPPPNSLRPAQLSLARLHERLAINPWRRILLGTLAGLSVTSLMLALALWSTRVVSSLLGLAAGGIV